MAYPAPSAVAELLKPITWFPPMWAFACGAVASGQSWSERWALVALGVLLAGPMVCATSQAVNDWFDRHVDAINEPNRPIPSGRMPGRWGLYIAVLWTVLSLAVALTLGPWGFVAALFGLALAWAYSAPPLRLKRNGWWGNAACGICYEGLAWVTGAIVMAGGSLPDGRSLALAALYSLGAHGIMTLNDFKSVEGDRRMGIGSLPVRLGEEQAAHMACWMMAAPQFVVVVLLLSWQARGHALAVGALLAMQLLLMRRFVADPHGRATWYSGLGVTLYVAGMLVSAFALRAAAQADEAVKPLGWFGIVRLGLVQMALGAIVVLTTSTLNRVMVVELALPALVPGLLVAIHYAVQITRPRMGFGSDRSGRCTPWILGGMAVLAAGGTLAAVATAWMATQRYPGLALAAFAFLLVGLGVSACGTSVLVLLAKSVVAQRRAPAATIVWMMMIIGFAVTAGMAGRWLDPYTPQRLVAVSGGVAAIACLVALVALWRLEGRGGVAAGAAVEAEPKLRFLEALRQVWQEAAARRFTVFVFVSMLAFSAQDLILEPFAGAVFGLTPGATTQLSGLQHGGVLLGMIACALAGSRWGIGSLRSWTIGGCIASAFALAALVAAGVVGPRWPLHATVFVLGAANGAFSIAAIGSMMRLAGEGRASREGVRMGLWGASQAISFGVGGLAGAVASDIARRFIDSPGAAYALVFGAEALLFLWAAALAAGIEIRAPQRRTRRWAWTRSTPTMPS